MKEPWIAIDAIKLRLKELEDWTRSDEDMVHDRLRELERYPSLISHLDRTKDDLQIQINELKESYQGQFHEIEALEDSRDELKKDLEDQKLLYNHDNEAIRELIRDMAKLKKDLLHFNEMQLSEDQRLTTLVGEFKAMHQYFADRCCYIESSASQSLVNSENSIEAQLQELKGYLAGFIQNSALKGNNSIEKPTSRSCIVCPSCENMLDIVVTP